MNRSDRSGGRWALYISLVALVVAVADYRAQIPLPAVCAETQVAADQGVSFECDALALRALQSVRSYAERLRAAVERRCSGLHRPRVIEDATDKRTAESATPAVNSGRRATDELSFDLEKAFGPTVHDSDWDVRHLNAVSRDNLHGFRTLIELGIVRSPWIRDLTGRQTLARSLEDALTVLKRHDDAIAVFPWALLEAPLDARWRHEVTGGVFPLSPTDKLRYLRRRLGSIQVIWITRVGRETLSAELRDAADDSFTFLATMKRLRETATLLKTLSTVRLHQNDERRIVEADLGLAEQVMHDAEDLAVWNADPVSAFHLLDEIHRFLRQVNARSFAQEESDRYGVLTAQVAKLRDDLTTDPRRYIDRVRQGVARDASPAALATLKALIPNGLVLDVPGDGANAATRDKGLELIGLVVGPKDGHPLIAPWMYGVEVSILQPVSANGRDESWAVTDLPVTLVNLTSGAQYIRRLLHNTAEIPDYELSTASFLNIAPGKYRIELLLPPFSVADLRQPPRGPPGSSRRRWAAVFARMRAAWSAARDRILAQRRLLSAA